MGESSYEVVVVGAGPAGSATASLFAGMGRKVLLVDAAQFPRSKPCAEYISPGGAAILERLGGFDYLDPRRAGRWLRGMFVRAPGGDCHLIEYQDRTGRARRGLSVSRLALDAALLELARARGAEVREAFRTTGVWLERGLPRGIIGPNGERVGAELVVGADGLHSIVARGLGVQRPARWPRRLGLVAHFEGVEWPEDYGQMVVGRRGYVGVAPLSDNGLVTVGLVRSMPVGRLGSSAAALAAGLADYPDLATRMSRGRLVGNVVGIGPLASRVRGSAGPGYALVGDAAGFFDPFTGEGIFRALRSAELLAADPTHYAVERARAFAPKERLVALIQVFVHTPRLMDFAIQRLRRRPEVARHLGSVLGDLERAGLGLAWRLLGP